MFGIKVNLFSILILIIVVLILIIIIIYKNPFGEPSVKINLSSSSVIKEIQKLGSLETASYSIEKIVEAGQQENPFADLLYGDRILLIAHGKVTAGVDLYIVTENDINVQDKSLVVNLSAPKILSSTLDNSKTRVYDRTQGYLNRGNKDLETKARQAAEESIKQAACEAGILEEARKNAVERIKQLFEFAGFTSVNVNVAAGSC